MTPAGARGPLCLAALALGLGTNWGTSWGAAAQEPPVPPPTEDAAPPGARLPDTRAVDDPGAQAAPWVDAWRALSAAQGEGARAVRLLDLVDRVLAYDSLPERYRTLAQFLRAAALVRAGEPEAARDLLWRLYDDGRHYPDGLITLLQLERQLGGVAGEGRALIALARTYPFAAQKLNPAYAVSVLGRLHRAAEAGELPARQADQPPRHLALLDALYKAGVEPVTAEGLSPDFFYEDLIGHYVDRGDLAAARRLALRVRSYRVLMDLKIDRRFEPLWDFVDALVVPDLASAGRKALAHAREQAARLPDAPAAQLRLVEELIRVGDFAGALEDARITLARFGDGGDEKSLYFLDNMIVYALVALDRDDAARERMAGLLDLDLATHPDVLNQWINYGFVLADLGDADAAINLARRARTQQVNPLSPYGAGFVRAVEVCALDLLDREDESAETMAWFDANPMVNAEATAYALACRGDDAGLAALFKARLADPEQRGPALRTLSAHRINGPTDGAIHARVFAALDRLRADPEVMAAARAAGRLTDQPLDLAFVNALE